MRVVWDTNGVGCEWFRVQVVWNEDGCVGSVGVGFYEKCECVMICVGPAGRVICPVLKLFNIAVFSDTVNVMNIKLCMMVLLTELCLFIPLSMTVTVFQGHSCVKQFQLNFFFFSI